MNKGENIAKWMKGQTISWLGHLERVDEDRMPKKIFTQELEGTRRRGRPRKRWKEEVERDLQVLGVRRWRDLVTDGATGRTLFDRPKPTVGCSVNGRKEGRKEGREEGRNNNNNNNNNDNIAATELGHLLTRSGLTYPEVSSVVFPGSFCLLVGSFSLSWVTGSSVTGHSVDMLYPISVAAVYFVQN
jgi:hypothetical protein